MDRPQGSPWSAPDTVAGFAQSPPNAVLMSFAARERERGAVLALDLGCGAGRNAVPMAEAGWDVVGLDLSWEMLRAAASRNAAGRLRLMQAPMDALPVRDGVFDMVIAHGIWNLARSGAEFRRGVREAARVAKSGAGLFVFTFSRTAIPTEARPVAGEPFVYTAFSGQPQCFLTAEQLFAELGEAGFVHDPGVPLTEYNRPQPGRWRAGGPPVIWEAAFRKERDR